MRLDIPPLFERLASSQRILLAGAGGGYDILAGLPLYECLRGLGKEVYLANRFVLQLAPSPGSLDRD